MYFDLPVEQPRSYQPTPREPSDFDAFWRETLAQARHLPLAARFEPVDYGLQTVDTFDLTLNGYAGQSVKGWLLLPRQRSGPLACIVETIGYGGGRSFPLDWLLWSSVGYAHLGIN